MTKGAAWSTVAAIHLVWCAAPEAQLRPLEPLDWAVFDAGVTLTAGVGIGTYLRQELSFAGTEGRLVELGEYHLSWRSGRVVLEGRGTLHRVFDDRRRTREPTANVQVPFGERRRDAGDHLALTTVRLTPEERPLLAVVRFGTRLPTTDDRTGLERDMTDFLATVGARRDVGTWRVWGETGVGIHGTRDPDFEQVDHLLYMLGVEYRRERHSLALTALGQTFPAAWEIRGNEDLGEARLVLRTGGRLGMEIGAVRGYTRFSPERGFFVAARSAW
jgi:hypothetical protein